MGSHNSEYFPIGSYWYGEKPGHNLFFQVVSYTPRRIEMVEVCPIIYDPKKGFWDVLFMVNSYCVKSNKIFRAVPKLDKNYQPVVYHKNIYMKPFPTNKWVRFEDLPRVNPREDYKNFLPDFICFS